MIIGKSLSIETKFPEKRAENKDIRETDGGQSDWVNQPTEIDPFSRGVFNFGAKVHHDLNRASVRIRLSTERTVILSDQKTKTAFDVRISELRQQANALVRLSLGNLDQLSRTALLIATTAVKADRGILLLASESLGQERMWLQGFDRQQTDFLQQNRRQLKMLPIQGGTNVLGLPKSESLLEELLCETGLNHNMITSHAFGASLNLDATLILSGPDDREFDEIDLAVIDVLAAISTGAYVNCLQQTQLSGLIGEVEASARAAQEKSRQLEEELEERRKVEAQLQRAAGLAHNYPSPVLQTDRAGTIEDANQLAETLLGRNLGGQPLDHVFPNLDKALLSRLSPGDTHQFEHKIDDHTFLITVKLNETGETLFVYGTEITDRKIAESVLRSQEYRSRTILDSVQAGLVVIDPKSRRIVDANLMALHMLGGRRDQVLGVRCDQHLCNQTASSCELLDQDGNILEKECRLVTLKGEELPVFKTATRVRFDDQSYILESFIDISKLKHAEQQQQALTDKLERAERMESLGLLAGGVAHDLNNMLGPLVGYPELILRKLETDSPVRRQVERIGQSARDAAEVIQDLLTMSRRGRYQMVHLDFNDVVRAYLDSPSFLKLAEDRCEITLNVNLAPEALSIEGSAPHLGKLVMNLIVNAYEAMPDGGTLDIETRFQDLTESDVKDESFEPGRFVQFSVKDSGMGIQPQDIERIFEPYFSKKKMGTSGSGIGLAVVYGILKDHQGLHKIKSAPDQGTQFLMSFPESVEVSSEPEKDTELVGGSETVLIVDDVPEVREMGALLLSSLGYQVETASSGREAVAFLQHNDVGLVVLDMIMEDDFDGLDTFREIRSAKPEQKAIIVSGYAATDRVDEALSLGAGNYLRKPYSLEQIGRAVREELDRDGDESEIAVAEPIEVAT